jgi:hypothetical protein
MDSEKRLEIVREKFVYEIPREHWENPEKIKWLLVNLPGGISARFLRAEDWEKRPYKPLV